MLSVTITILVSYTDEHGNLCGRKRPQPNYKDGDITIDSSLLLLNFISSKMTAKEYEEGMLNLHFMATTYGYDRYGYRGRNYDYEAAKAEQWKDDLPILCLVAFNFHLLH